MSDKEFPRRVWFLSEEEHASLWSENAVLMKDRFIRDSDSVVKVLRDWIDGSMKRFLDIGCGVGDYLSYYSGKMRFSVGCDFTMDALRLGREKYPFLRWVRGDLNRLPLKGSVFDLVISLGVFEHDERGLDRAVQESRRVLSDSGILFFTVPYLNRIRKRKVVRGEKGSGAPPPAAGQVFYQYAYSEEELRHTLEKYGLSARSFYYFHPDLGVSTELPPFARNNKPLFFLLKSLKVAGLLPDSLGHMIGVVCRKEPADRSGDGRNR